MPYITEGHKLISIHIFHLYCPILVKIGPRDLHIMLLRTVGFHDTQRSKEHPFLMGVNEITFLHVRGNRMTLSN